MNELEQLNKRISRLVVAIKTRNEEIKRMENALNEAKEERDRLLDQQRESEPRFERVKYGHDYRHIAFTPEGLEVCKDRDDYIYLDDGYYDNNNYFYTEERAQEVADKINFLLKLERLHDTFCPDYIPNWDAVQETFAIYYHHATKRYEIQPYACMRHPTTVYFSTEETAQKVCDILNKELEEKKGNDY